jgi:ClpP class serine protease
MPNWNDVLVELQANSRSPHDHLRLKYLKQVHEHTGRNVLTYYSGWLHKPQFRGNPAIEFQIIDADKTGFMTCSHGVDRSKGLDLILHTPGGDVAATESLIDYLHSLYAGDVRAIVPQIAMSGGTLMALSCKEIVMGNHSSIGPIDPQIMNMPAQGIIEEFEKGCRRN